MIFANVSFVDGTALAEELKLLGPQYAKGVIVTEVAPAVSGYSSVVLDYRNALAKYFPGESPDYVSLEGYIAADILIQGLKRAGPELDTEKLDRRSGEPARSRSGSWHQAQFRPRRTSGLAPYLGNRA